MPSAIACEFCTETDTDKPVETDTAADVDSEAEAAADDAEVEDETGAEVETEVEVLANVGVEEDAETDEETETDGDPTVEAEETTDAVSSLDVGFVRVSEAAPVAACAASFERMSGNASRVIANSTNIYLTIDIFFIIIFTAKSQKLYQILIYYIMILSLTMGK